MLMAGGSGNNKGAILGAYIIWFVWTIASKFLTDLLPYTLKARAPYIRFLLIWILLEIILIYRPQGLLGEEKRVSKLME
jgi:branched-chain amino acid transport system permease protein